MLWLLIYSSKLDWGSYIISTEKTASKKIGALIRWSFFLLRFLCISINLPYNHAWNTFVIPGSVPLVATWNCWIKNRYAGLLVLQLLPLLNLWLIVASVKSVLSQCSQVNSFHRYYFGRCSSELGQLVPLPFCHKRSTPYSDRLHNFSLTIPRCYRDVYVNSFFPHTARLWNSLPIECFPLTYDLNSFKSRIDRHLLTVGSF